MNFVTAALFVLSLLITGPGLGISAIYTTEDGLPSNEVRFVLKDRDSRIWAGSGKGHAWYEDGLWKIDQSDINPITHGVSTIYQDSRMNLWFGGLGISHVYDGHAYKTFSIREDMGLDGRVVFSFHEDHDQNIWAVTTGGAAIYDGTKWSQFAMSQGLNNNIIHDIEQDAEGKFWFATRKGGLNIYDGSEWQYLYVDKNCRKILKDDGYMWVGTNDGVLRYDEQAKIWKVFEEGKTVLPMFRGDKEHIWCIVSGLDIIRISPSGSVIRYDNPATNAEEIFHLEPGSNGSVWAGTNIGVVVLR